MSQAVGKIVSNVSDSYSDIPREVWILSGVSFVNRCGTMVLFFISIYLSQSMGFDIVTTGKIVGCYGIGTILGAVAGGIITDRKGPFFVQISSLFFTAACFWSLEFLHSVAAFSVALFFSGMFFDMIRPANSAAIARYCDPDNRVKAFALERQAVNLGNAIGPTLGGLVVAYDFNWLFRLDAATCILALALLWFSFYDQPRMKSVSVQPSEGKAGNGRAIFRDKNFLFFLVIVLLTGICFFAVYSVYPIFMKTRYLMTELQFGSLMSLNAVLIILFEMILVNYARRFHTLSVIGAGACLMGLGFAVLPLGSGYLFALVAMCIWSAGEMVSLPFMSAHIANTADERNQGRYLGVYIGVFTSGLVFGPVIGSLVINGPGYTVLWLSAGVLGVLIWLLARLLQLQK